MHHTLPGPLRLLGLTGGVGMGKSTAADCLARWGLAIVDTDQLARDLVAPGQPANLEIRRAFGDSVLDAAGRVRRDVLAEIVFADEARRRELEAILHPRIRTAWLEIAEQWRLQQRPMGVVVIPLLFETGAASAFTATICVGCSAASQQERLRARGWSPAAIEQRVRAQWPLERKLVAADFVVWAEGGGAQTSRQLERILARLGCGIPGEAATLPLRGDASAAVPEPQP